MTVCQFYLQGRCRYGKNCKFEHDVNTDDRNNRNPANAQQLNNAVKQIVEEVILSEKGGQWPLSCFSPVKGGTNIPGWEDISPEEVRWKMYEARANGTLSQCTQEINQWYRNAEKARNLLKEPTMERVNLIVNFLKGKREQSNSPADFTASSSTPSIFGGSAQTATNQNIFRSAATAPGSHGSIFGNSSISTGNIFGGSTQSSENIFGASQSFSNQNIFGGSNTHNTFSQNVFSNPQSSNQNIFSTTSLPGSGNVFPNQTVSSQNIFSKPVEGNKQNAFLTQNTPPAFASQSSSGSLFGSNSTFFQQSENQNKSNVFTCSQSDNIFKQNAFDKTNAFNNSQDPGKVIFGAASQQNAFNTNPQSSKEFDSSIYSKLEDLTEDEIQRFTSATFAYGKIPLKPPLKEYCHTRCITRERPISAFPRLHDALCIVVENDVPNIWFHYKSRSSQDHEATGMMKAQFMFLWDDLGTHPNKTVIVMGATNRPQVMEKKLNKNF